jgi:hypothetical protein
MKTFKFERSRSGDRVRTLVAVLCAALSPALVEAASQAPVLVQTSAIAATPAADARFADATVQAQVVRKDDQLSLNLQTAAGQRSVKLSDAVDRVQAIHRFGDRLVVLGRLGEGGATEVCIVEVSNGRIADRFWAYDPAVSPDGSMVAFVRFYPRHFSDGVESQYRLYRVGSSSDADQAPADKNHARVDAGQPVFADAAQGRTPRANFGVADAVAHTHLSHLVWSADSSRFGVIDAHGKTVRALVWPVSAEGAPVAQVVEGMDSVCLPARNDQCDELPFDAVSLTFDARGDALRLKINDRTLFPKGYSKAMPLKGFNTLR